MMTPGKMNIPEKNIFMPYAEANRSSPYLSTKMTTAKLMFPPTPRPYIIQPVARHAKLLENAVTE